MSRAEGGLFIALIAAVAALAAGPVRAEGDSGRGAEAFRACAPCHRTGAETEHFVGPALGGVIGRRAGSLGGFDYSAAMIAAGRDGLVWDEEALDGYMADPRGFLRGSRMAFAGIADAAVRADIIAFLKAQ